MRIRISHETRYRYDTPPTGVIQTLRLTPRNHDGQFVVDWRIDVSADCRLDEHEDAFGNITHTFTAERAARPTLPSPSRARSRRRTPTASCAARSSASRRACSCARRR